MGTACYVRGSPRLVDTIEGQLNISCGETTADRAFTLERVNCLGCCALGPVVVVDGVYTDHMTSSKMRKLVTAIREQDKEESQDDE
jgi:NADH-quinone oxidoreductase subunit E